MASTITPRMKTRVKFGATGKQVASSKLNFGFPRILISFVGRQQTIFQGSRMRLFVVLFRLLILFQQYCLMSPLWGLSEGSVSGACKTQGSMHIHNLLDQE